MSYVAWALLWVTAVAAAEKPADFAYGFALTTHGESAFYRFELPADVYRGTTRLDAGDVRVFNGDGAAVPFAFMPHVVMWPEQSAPDVLEVQSMSGERAPESPRHWTEPTAAAAGAEGDYEFDTEGIFPIDRVSVELSEQNSVVPARVYARHRAQDPWRLITTTVFYRLHQDAGDVTPPAIAVDGAGLRYWLLRVDPKSGATSAQLPRLRVGWIAQEIVFAARGSAPFVVAYGSPGAAPAALPITTLVPGYGTASAPIIAVATIQSGSTNIVGGPERLIQPPDIKRWLLWCMLALGVIVLGWMARRLARELERLPRSDADASARKQ